MTTTASWPAFRRLCCGLIKVFRDKPATVIAERIGWDRSLTVLKERVRELRPVYAPTEPAGADNDVRPVHRRFAYDDEILVRSTPSSDLARFLNAFE